MKTDSKAALAPRAERGGPIRNAARTPSFRHGLARLRIANGRRHEPTTIARGQFET